VLRAAPYSLRSPARTAGRLCLLGGGGAGNSVGQKNFKKKLKKQKAAYKKLKGTDANPDYAFDI
jgi:hypothetical protein